jgi:ABC-type antimicrobial peptide transport system permease subunit
MFTDRDVRNGSQVCLIGQTLLRELFEGRSPLGQTLRIQNVSFKIVGVLSRKGPNMMGIDQDDIVLAPWTTIKYQVSGTTMTSVAQAVPTAIDSAQQINSLNQRYPGRQSLYPLASAAQIADTPQPVRFTTVDQILVKTKSAQIASQTIQQITQLLHERHRIHPQQDDDFSVRDMSELMQALASTSLLIGSLLLAVALISLMVGGVGIMNIMLVSVTERTREIGLRMALGAAPQMILEQFLVEAVVLCMLGGAFGIILGRTGSFLVHALLKWPTEMSLPAIAAAVGVSVTVGVVFGFYPAWKASRLDPIAALRYE